MITLGQLVQSASKNEQIKLWINDKPVTGKFTKDEILNGEVPDLINAHDVYVLRWYSMNDTISPYVTYTLVECRKAGDTPYAD